MIEAFLLDKGVTKIPKEKILSNHKKRIWVDLVNPTHEELLMIKDIFDIHPLTIEDLTRKGMRIKFERFDNYTFLVLYGVLTNKKMSFHKMNFIVGKDFLITIRASNLEGFNNLKKDISSVSASLKQGPDFVMHKIIDFEVDKYLDLLENYENLIDHLEERAISNPVNKLLLDIFEVRKQLNNLRKITSTQREVLHNLSSGQVSFISKGVLPYLRDVHDHIIMVSDSIMSEKEQINNILEIYLSSVSNKSNDIMKTLTIVATIILPLTLITGIYGMNFPNMPELGWEYGYFTVIGIMTFIAITLITIFKFKKWF